MNVSPNYNSGPVTRAGWKTSTPSAVGNPSDTAQFGRAAALDRALQDTPGVRAAEVERARDLIGDVAYPPTEIIHRISVLLARKLSGTPDES